jgi:DNA-binding SARP family transcriptional activator/tetratricopeptide (TPR) repeat protein
VLERVLVVDFGLLGPLTVSDGARPVVVSAPRQRVLLAALLLDAGRVVSVDTLTEVLWDGEPPAGARGAMHSAIQRLRSALGSAGAGLIGTAPPGYVLRLGDAGFDVREFGVLSARGRAAARTGAWTQAAGLLREALGLWRGEALADVPSPLLRQREVPGLEDARLQVLGARIDADLALGRHGEVVAELRQLVAAHPLWEHFAAQLMLGLHRSGRQGDALAAYQDVRRVLAAELGVDPGPELRRLQQQILAADPALILTGNGAAATGAAAIPGPATVPGPTATPGPTAAPRPAGQPGLPASGLPGPAASGAPDSPAPGPPGSAARPADEPADAEAARAGVVPRQLPVAARHFAGRAGALTVLAGLAAEAGGADGAGRAMVISVIEGTAGIGKTALAVHFAHQVAGDFPDGQLYVNLRGFDPAGPPMTPGEAVRIFLDALGVRAGQLPASLDAQVGLYRSLLAGRRMLVLLDNARDAGQVRPLLPASPGCLVLVTSRSQLTGLAAAEGAMPLALDLLTGEEAKELLAARLGGDRLAADPAAAQELTGLCARLPLALAIAAARAATQPALALADLAAELRDAGGRLDALDAGDAAASVRAVFSWSYQQLDAASARMFRLLGLHPGPAIGTPAAASLAGLPLRPARTVLTELTRAHLLAEPAPGRFAFHDLLRAYAAERAQAGEGGTERHAAVHRMLDHYLHTACPAALLIHPTSQTMTLPPLQPGVEPQHLADIGQAQAWFESERQVLMAAATQALEEGFYTHAWQIAWALGRFLDLLGHWDDWVAAEHIALTATERLGDRAAQAFAHWQFGYARARLGDYKDAHAHLERALSIYTELRDGTGAAEAHITLGVMLEEQGRDADALGHTRQALELFNAAGDRAGQALALNGIGWLHIKLGDYRQARTSCGQALELFQERGYPRLEADIWDSLGLAHHHLGDHAEAAACYQRALGLYREIGDRWAQAETLGHIGDTRLAAGQPDEARAAWEEALAILDDLHHPDAGRVRTKLAGLGAAPRT